MRERVQRIGQAHLTNDLGWQLEEDIEATLGYLVAVETENAALTRERDEARAQAERYRKALEVINAKCQTGPTKQGPWLKRVIAVRDISAGALSEQEVADA